MTERKETLAEILTEENENLYEANKYAIYTDYHTSREMLYKVCAFNRKLIESISSLEEKIAELENKLRGEKEETVSFEVLSKSAEEGNWFFLTALADGIEYKVEAKVAKEPEERYGLVQSGHRIVKFFVKDKTNNRTIVMSDRGYVAGEENLEKPLILDFIKTILEFADKEYEKCSSEI